MEGVRGNCVMSFLGIDLICVWLEACLVSFQVSTDLIFAYVLKVFTIFSTFVAVLVFHNVL